MKHSTALYLVAAVLFSAPLWAAEQVAGSNPAAATGGFQVTVMATGATEGSLETCGCKHKQAGGLARRAFFFEHLRQEGKALLPLEAGHAFTAGQDLEVRRTKLYAQMLKTMGYQALNVTESELGMGPDFLRSINTDVGLPLLSTNLTVSGATAPWQPYLIRTVNQVRFLIVGVMPNGSPVSCGKLAVQVGDPIAAVIATATAHRGEADALIVLSSLPREDEDKLVAAEPDIAVIISCNPDAEPSRKIGETTVAAATLEGKTVQELDLTYSPDTKQFSSATVSQEMLLPEKSEDQAVRTQLNAFYDSIWSDQQYMSKALHPLADLPEEKNPDNAYVGMAACTSCHPDENKQWLTTPHAKAFTEVLGTTFYHPDCVACHVTGFGEPTGFTQLRMTSPLLHVQCEACHGPGKLHTEKPKEAHMRKTLDQTNCAQCHTPEWSKDFPTKYTELYGLIQHKKQ